MAASLTNLVDSVLKTFEDVTAKPEHFLSVQDAASEKFKSITKNLYDFGRSYQANRAKGGLPELYIEGFEEEQVWQQLELYNEPVFNILMKNVAQLLTKGKNLSFQVTKTQKDENEEAIDDEEVDMGDEDSNSSGSSLDIPKYVDDDDQEDSDVDETNELKFDEFDILDDNYKEKKRKTEIKPTQKIQKSVVDDQFFKLREMKEFLKKEEQQDGNTAPDDEDEDIDYFDDVQSEEEDEDCEAKTAKYSDFFVSDDQPTTAKRHIPAEDLEADDDEEEDDLDEEEDEDGDQEPGKKRVKFNLEDSEDDDDGDSDDSEDDEALGDKSEVKSSYEATQERLRAKIAELEEEALQPKSWQMLGETKADLRPENALLEEDLAFDHTSRQAPVITEETTRTLEDIIKRRIKDQAFDDVVRKIKPVVDPSDFKKQLVLDQEKSKFSLAEIYEQEYLKQQEQQQQQPRSSSLADPIQDKSTPDSAAHLKIRKMMNDLFAKLNALSNFHYTPRMPMPEIKIVSNMPSIAMEEIAPVAVSDANLLAPEEVQDHIRGEVKTTSEKEKVDRLRERRKKKLLQGKRRKERELTEKAVDKANPGLGNKHAKLRTLRQLQKAEKEGTVTLIKDNKNRNLKSSTAFFTQLQEEVSTQVRAVKDKSKNPIEKDKRLSGTKLKL